MNLSILPLCAFLPFALATLCAADPSPKTALGVTKTSFTINGKPTFLLGFSYYGALGASEDFIRRDLDDFQRRGFNWLRVWGTWDAFDHSISAFDLKGHPREPYFTK